MAYASTFLKNLFSYGFFFSIEAEFRDIWIYNEHLHCFILRQACVGAKKLDSDGA